MSDDVLLEVEDLAVSAGGKTLLEGIELQVGRGEMVAVTGPSGCGKTTFVRSVAGLVDPERGRVLFKGRTADETGWPQFRRSVVLVAQRPVMMEGTVRAGLERPFTYGTASGPFPQERARELLDRLGLEATIDQAARSLSEGQQQRLSLVRALLVEPEVLLLDEPTSSLDSELVGSVEDLLRDLAREQGTAALVVTHEARQARRWCAHCVDLQSFGASGGHDA
jgi:ABC-type multidrug transport system ATPase subunit